MRGRTQPDTRLPRLSGRLPGPGLRRTRGGPVHEPFALTAVARGHLLALTGRLDVIAAADARLALADAVDDGEGDLVLDLAELAAVDATGLGVLVGAHRRAGRSGRTLVLRDVPPSVGRLLLVTRLDKVLRQSSSSHVA